MYLSETCRLFCASFCPHPWAFTSPFLPGHQATNMLVTGDRVLLHYTVRLLDGTKFASSPDSRDKFSLIWEKVGKTRLGS